jgi:putative hemolysin
MTAMPARTSLLGQIPPLPASTGRYELAFVGSGPELEPVQRLRYEVFNVELNEGLDASRATGLDQDEFDPHCHHLIIRDTKSDRVVGTYRMQTAAMAERGAGLYAATEYDLSGLPVEVLGSALEIGRAAIASDHRNLKVLYLLWQGLGRYMAHNSLSHLFGCCSLTSQDAHEATRVYRRLQRSGQTDSRYLVRPLEELACLVEDPEPGSSHIPRLMRTYLSLGATICSEPALDKQFKTVDYLALFDLGTMHPARLAFFQCTP